MNRVILNAFFPGEPVTWKRAQGRGLRRFNPKYMKAAQERLRRQFRMIKPGWKPDEKSRFGIQAIYHVSQLGDGSNFQKLLEDAFNRVIWQDDEQIDEWQGKKHKVPKFIECGITLLVYVIE